jgi:hypothetical protein
MMGMEGVVEWRRGVVRYMKRWTYLSFEITPYSPRSRSCTGIDQVQIDLTSKRISLWISYIHKEGGIKQRLTALSLSALLINRFASSTSSNSTSSLHLILACASLNRIILSNCLVVAVILFSWVRESIPALRISTYADINAFDACSVRTGWILARA